MIDLLDPLFARVSFFFSAWIELCLFYRKAHDAPATGNWKIVRYTSAYLTTKPSQCLVKRACWGRPQWHRQGRTFWIRFCCGFVVSESLFFRSLLVNLQRETAEALPGKQRETLRRCSWVPSLGEAVTGSDSLCLSLQDSEDLDFSEPRFAASFVVLWLCGTLCCILCRH